MSRIGIIGAMHPECESLRAQLHLAQHSQYLNLKITRGQWAGHRVCLLESGIGKVNATLAAEWLAREFEPDLVINTGSAGGIKNGAQVGDFVFADRVCHHDVDISPIGFAFGELPDLPVYYEVKPHWLELLRQTAEHLHDPYHIGTIATGESFIYQPQQVTTIQQRLSLIHI